MASSNPPPGLSSLPRPTHLVLDFDGTLTMKDTMRMLGALPRQPYYTWRALTQVYLQAYKMYEKTPFPWRNYDQTEYSAWLASRKWVEECSARRAQDSGFFKGVKADDVNSIVDSALNSGRVQMRDGWLDLFALFLPDHEASDAASNGSKLSILSVNWSETFIRRVLLEAARRSSHAQKDLICEYISNMDIKANEIEGLESPEGSSGRVFRPSRELDVRTSDDKLRFLPSVSQDPVNDKSPTVVYVGDSSTDFDCLWAAHRGLWLCDVPREDHRQAFKDTFKPLNLLPVPYDILGNTVPHHSIIWCPNFNAVMKTILK